MSTQSQRRVPCGNEQDGREFFELTRTSVGIRITTPGALTRTRWSRDQARVLRDALSDLVGEGYR